LGVAWKGKRMKRVLIIAGILVAVTGLVIGYLAVIGMNDEIEAVSTGNTVKFSRPSAAAQATHLMSSFSPIENVTVHLEGLFSGKGGLKPDELNLTVKMKGHHRRRLFDASSHFVCSEVEMREHIRRQLVVLTGDQNLEVRRLNLPTSRGHRVKVLDYEIP
jgi:hypothetical protein